jgi:thioredoxin reductase (NADPH)
MLKVTLSDGSSDEYKTVLAATGRRADTQALGLDTLVDVNPKNGKIVCSNEQTSVPHIYAVGDVVDNAPELTPVAIQAGRLLAHRLFGDSTQVRTHNFTLTSFLSSSLHVCRVIFVLKQVRMVASSK